MELDSIKIRVSDNGVGMPDEVKSKLFSMEKSNITNGTNGERGTGLGLILCRDIVLKHGGNLEIESKLGEGTTITILFPKADVSN